MRDSKKSNILFLANTTHHTQAVLDHIQAITSSLAFHWHVMNPLQCKTIDKLDFSCFDAVGLHYSVKPYDHYYLSRSLKKKIADFLGTKFLFLQDEYQKVNCVQEFLYALGFDLLFTLVHPQRISEAYPDSRLHRLKKVSVLTGYVSDHMKSIDSPLITDRTIDVSYRGRRCEYWLGRLAYEKEWIATEFVKRANGHGITYDISLEEVDRVYGDEWLRLLMNSKAVLGTESGASIWDFDESIQKRTNRYLAQHRGVDFETVYEQVLKPHDGRILYNAISPRVFEAAATKTPMILFPGEYNEVCKPDLHYIVLEKDFSNIHEVFERLRDTEYLQSLADRAHADLIESDTYSQHAFSHVVSEALLAQMTTQSHQAVMILNSAIELTMRKYRALNQLRCLSTEVSFVMLNFFKLLFDPKDSLLSKIKMLTQGMQRYVAYLMPRLKKR